MSFVFLILWMRKYSLKTFISGTIPGQSRALRKSFCILLLVSHRNSIPYRILNGIFKATVTSTVQRMIIKMCKLEARYQSSAIPGFRGCLFYIRMRWKYWLSLFLPLRFRHCQWDWCFRMRIINRTGEPQVLPQGAHVKPGGQRSCRFSNPSIARCLRCSCKSFSCCCR